MKICLISAGQSGWFLGHTLLGSSHQLAGVISLPVEQAAKKSTYRHFGDLATEAGAALHTTSNINSETSCEFASSVGADIHVVMGWSQILREKILSIPPRGTIGNHISPLPDHRGGAPLNWALIRDEKSWATSLYEMTRGIDEGPIYGQRAFPISDRDTVAHLYERSAFHTTGLLMEVLDGIESGKLKGTPQGAPVHAPTPARKPSDGEICWEESPRTIWNFVRALTRPYPGGFSWINGQRQIFFHGMEMDTAVASDEKPGTLLEIREGKGCAIACGQGILWATLAGFANSPVIWADELAEYSDWKVGDHFCSRVE